MTPQPESMNPAPLPASKAGFALLRIAIGMSMFLHGATRIGAGPEKFAHTLLPEFQATILPQGLVHIFGLVLPFIEGGIGFLLLLGWLTRGALLAGMATMVMLIFGTGLRSEWNTIALQLTYAVIFYILLARIGDNCWALDKAAASRR